MNRTILVNRDQPYTEDEEEASPSHHPSVIAVRFGDVCAYGLHWSDDGKCSDHDLVEKVSGLLKALSVGDIASYLQHQPQISNNERVSALLTCACIVTVDRGLTITHSST